MNAVEILNEVLSLIQGAAALAQELQAAQSSGVDITKDQLDEAAADYVAARQKLDDLIASHGK